MKALILPGLIGSNPLGALASFGLLRLVSTVDPHAKLGFVMRDDWVSCIESTTVTSKAGLIGTLTNWLGAEDLDRALNWADDARVQPDVYRTLLRNALTAGDAVRCGFLCSLVADGAVDTQKHLVKPSAFYMVSGQQSFLGGLRDILARARKSTEAIFNEAIFGPWRYSIRAHSLGWDPNTERLHALRACAPSSDDPSCVASAMLLAFWALPMMPALSCEGRAQTIGFTRAGRDQSFSWPIFSKAIDVAELATLLQVGVKAWRGSRGLRPGIETVFESSRFEFGQGYAVMRPAQRLRL
jgi:hypothetical protein